MKNIVLIGIIFLTIAKTSAQSHFVFLPDVYGKSIDGLGVFKIQNATGARFSGNAVITVHESHSNLEVVKIKTPVITVTPGVYSFSSGLFSGSSFAFSNNSLASIVSQTRNFPPGEYTFCYSFIVDQNH